MFLSKLGFLFQKSQFLYSLLLVILIPAALVINTLWVLRAVDRDVNQQLRTEAVLVGSLLGNLSTDKLGDPETLKNQFAKLKKDQPEITDVSLFTLNAANKANLVVSTSSLGQEGSDPVLLQLVQSSGQATAAEIKLPDSTQKVWSVVAPIKDDTGTLTALVDVKISTAEVENIINRTNRDSLWVLLATVIVVLLLLVNHLRFFEYAVLFRKIKEIDKMKDDFISMASHELRTPLTALRGFSDLLLRDPEVGKNEKAKHYATVINEGTARLADLVDDLLNVSRIEQNRMSFEFKPLNLGVIISQIVQELKVQADQKGLVLEVILLPNQANIVADEARLKQVLVNIIGNAIKYTPHGQVSISQKIRGGNLETYVEDTGVGMSPENREHLFEEFYRIRTDETKDIPGTGLGLWITKKIVEKMKGRIFVDSIEGKGSRFTVEFPIAS